MGRRFLDHKGGGYNRDSPIFLCKHCNCYLTNKEEMISDRFTGSTGKAYLFDGVWNIRMLEVEERDMMTGKHLVRDVHCIHCDKRLGWMYEFAMNDDQKYKESKVILENALVLKVEGVADPEGYRTSTDYADRPPHIETLEKHFPR